MLWAPWRQTAPLRVTRATITFSGPAALTLNDSGRDIALSPDGTHLFYVGNNSTQLFVRALVALEPVAIASVGGIGIRDPFVSSDGQWVGFANANALSRQKVAITGGAPTTIAQVDGVLRGATWAADTIIFATLNGNTGLQRVSAGGGAIDVLTRPDREHGEGDHQGSAECENAHVLRGVCLPNTATFIGVCSIGEAGGIVSVVELPGLALTSRDSHVTIAASGASGKRR